MEYILNGFFLFNSNIFKGNIYILSFFKNIFLWTLQVYKFKIGTYTDAINSNDFCIIHFDSCQYSKIALEQKAAKFFLPKKNLFALFYSPNVCPISCLHSGCHMYTVESVDCLNY